MKQMLVDSVALVVFPLYFVLLQIDLYLAPTNQVARRVPTIFSVIANVAVLACAARSPNDTLLLYLYFVCTTFSLMLVQIVGLFQNLPEAVALFHTVYAFPNGLSYTLVCFGSIILLGTPVTMLFMKNRPLRVFSALVIWSFNALDGALFEANTAVNPCYLTTEMLYENVLFGLLIYFSYRVVMPPWLPW